MSKSKKFLNIKYIFDLFFNINIFLINSILYIKPHFIPSKSKKNKYKISLVIFDNKY